MYGFCLLFPSIEVSKQRNLKDNTQYDIAYLSPESVVVVQSFLQIKTIESNHISH